MGEYGTQFIFGVARQRSRAGPRHGTRRGPFPAARNRAQVIGYGL